VKGEGAFERAVGEMSGTGDVPRVGVRFRLFGEEPALRTLNLETSFGAF
jgi:hypothetical protein